MSAKSPNAQFCHIGLYVRDLAPMADFYTRVLGMIVTDSGVTDQGARIVFLSRSPTEHHQVVLIEGRTEAMGVGHINQLSFRLDSLQQLQRFNEILKAEGVRIDRTMNHGNAWSVYCYDPEGNRIELYAGSPWHIAQPCAEPLDLEDAEQVIRARTEAMVLADPTYLTGEEWTRRQAEALVVDE